MAGVEPLRIVKQGIRYGVAAHGHVAWLPAALWGAAAELERRMEAMNAEADRLNALIEAAQAEADATYPVQTAHYA